MSDEKEDENIPPKLEELVKRMDELEKKMEELIRKQKLLQDTVLHMYEAQRRRERGL